MARTMRIEAFAKVNLTLEVLGVRGDGYHALRSVVAPVSLSDTIELVPADSISSDVPYPDDLCVKAAKALRAWPTTDGRPAPSCGVAISVEKRIPVGGGLGGGSADAAAVLIALNSMWGLALAPEELAEVGAHVGSDVPALVLAQHYKSPVVMEGRGEIVRLVEGAGGAGCGPLDLVLVNPGVHTSTAKVFALAGERGEYEASATSECEKALALGDFGRVASLLVNDLAAPACRLHPEIERAMESLRSAGVDSVAMSGSGSTVFGLVESAARAEETVSAMSKMGLSAWGVRTLCRDMV